MKIDITPNELKILINDYELQIAMAKIEFYGNSHRNPVARAGSSITEMKSRLEHLEAEYEVRLNDIKVDYHVNSIEGVRVGRKFFEDMSMSDAMELLDELKSRGEL